MGWIERAVFCLPLSSILWTLGICEGWLATAPGFPNLDPPASGSLVVDVAAPRPIQASANPKTTVFQSSPAFSSFGSPQLDQQLRRYLHYLAQVGPPDVLIVGSSRALQGVDPLVLRRVLISRGYTEATVFNFGVNGATAQVVDLIVRRILTQEQLPRLILWADGSRALNSGRIDFTYSKITASEGYRQIIAGIRPTMPATRAPQPEQLCGGVPSNSEHEPLQAKSNPPHLLTPLQSLAQLFCQTSRSPEAISEAPTSLPLLSALNSYEMTGFHAVLNRFDPTFYFRQYPKVAGNYDADYRNFTLAGRQAIALHNVLNFAKAHRISVTFINMPLTQVYLDGARSRYERLFRLHMQQLADSKKVVFYDLSLRWQTQNRYFADPSHLNRYGAAVVSAQVGQRLQLSR